MCILGVHSCSNAVVYSVTHRNSAVERAAMCCHDAHACCSHGQKLPKPWGVTRSDTADIRRPSVPMQRVDVMVRIVKTMKKQIDNSSL